MARPRPVSPFRVSSGPSMTEERGETAQMSEVLRLIGTLSDEVLDAQIMKRPVPAVQAAALADAARLLQDHHIALPPMLLQVLHGLDRTAQPDDGVDADAPPSGDGEGSAKGLARFLRPFRNYRA